MCVALALVPVIGRVLCCWFCFCSCHCSCSCYCSSLLLLFLLLLGVIVRVRFYLLLFVFLFGGIVLVMWSRSWYRSYSLPVAINIIPVIVNGLTLVLVRCACDLFVFVVRLPVLCYASLFVIFGGVRCSCSWR